MRLSEIKLVIQSLVEKMTCPFCQKKTKETNVDVVNIVQNKCTLQIRCDHCQKETIVNADIQKRKIPFPLKKSNTNKKQAFTFEKLAHFSQDLQNLKGDLKDFL